MTAGCRSHASNSPHREAPGVALAEPQREPLTGAAAAEADIAAGRLIIQRYGWPSPWQQSYACLLDERLGVALDDMAGCNVTAELITSVAAYNRRMESEIAARFGPDALRRVEAEAKARWRAALPPPSADADADEPDVR